jgi:hypothetical protein
MAVELTSDNGQSMTVERGFGGCDEETLRRSTDNVSENHFDCLFDNNWVMDVRCN